MFSWAPAHPVSSSLFWSFLLSHPFQLPVPWAPRSGLRRRSLQETTLALAVDHVGQIPKPNPPNELPMMEINIFIKLL